MSRPLDLVVFGATGFTGRYVVQAAKKLLLTGVKWGIAGRNEQKLKDIAQADSPANPPEVILADVNDFESLKTMTAKTKVVVNVVGPYRLYGEPVVQACIATSTSLVDLCGEPEFLERVEVKYSAAAAEARCHIIQSCGFDSLPGDLAVALLQDRFAPSGALTNVKIFIEFHGGSKGVVLHYATYEAAVLGFGSQEDLRKLRLQAVRTKLNLLGKKPKLQAGPFVDERKPGQQCYLFPGSDASVIRRTQEHLTKENPNHISPHVGCFFAIASGILNRYKMALYGGTFTTLAQYAFGRNILLRYPKLFSNGTFTHSGPTEQQLSEASFAEDLFGEGYADVSKLPTDKDAPAPPPDKKVTMRVCGPEPGYIATSCIVLLAAKAVLQETSFLPPFGVWTPGYAFRKCTQFIAELREENITFTCEDA